MAVFTPPPRKGPPVIDTVSSNTLSNEYRDKIAIMYQAIGNILPEINFTIGGRSFTTPIMAGPIPGPDNAEGGSVSYAKAIEEAGSVYWSHFHDKETWLKVLEAGCPAIRVIKPLNDNGRLIEEIQCDTERGALGYAMDISHGVTVYGQIDRQQEQFNSKTADDLALLNDASPLPFFLKDVQSVRDAVIASDIGVAGIVLSGHNNRFPCAIPPLKLLPMVRDAVGDRLQIFVDGGLNTGYDVFKALALGADGTLCARNLAAAFVKGGYDGAVQKILQMTAELAGAMANTGSLDLKHINKDSIVIL